MNILVTGASGFVGSEVVRELLAAGHHVTCCVRDTHYVKQLFPTTNVVRADFLNDTTMEIWLPKLKDIDVVINTVGIFFHPRKSVVWKIHYDTPKALFQACEAANVKKIIQVSALGIDTVEVSYAKSKKAAEEYLQNCAVPAFILRPSLVYGRNWNGGMAMLLSLASLPLIIPVPGNGEQQFQPIYVNDLAKAITSLVDKTLDETTTLHAVPTEKVSLVEILKTLRSWLHLAAAKIINVPLALIHSSAMVGNLIPGSVLNTTAYQMMMQNNVTTTDHANRFADITGIVPRSFKEGMFDKPSTKYDKWQARLFYLRPLAKISLAFMWIASALCSAWLYPVDMSYAILSEIGTPQFLQPWFLYGASLINLLLGIALFSPYVKIVYWLQLITIVTYTIILTITLPATWVEPFGSVVKNIPIIMLIILLITLED